MYIFFLYTYYCRFIILLLYSWLHQYLSANINFFISHAINVILMKQVKHDDVFIYYSKYKSSKATFSTN